MKNLDVGAVLNVAYRYEINLRIQNIPGAGFYGCVPTYQIHYTGLRPTDFMKPTENLDVGNSPDFNINTWYSSTSITELCTYLFDSVAEQDADMLKNIKSHQRTDIEEVLNEAHDKGFQFIIESLPGLGYDVFLLNEKRDLYQLKQFNSYDADDIAAWISDLMRNAQIEKILVARDIP